MNCPRCRQRTEVVKTEPAPGGAKTRLRRCPQHGRFWTKAIEKLTEWVDEILLPATLPATAKAVAQPLPRKSDSDLNSSGPIRSVSETSQGVDQEKPSDHAAMRAEFVRQWEAQYQDKYPFEPKDGAQLASMILKHPELKDRWPKMVARYLAEPFWAKKRHPLVALVTRPVEFAADVKLPATKDDRCAFHRAYGTRGKRPPAGWIAACPECKHGQAVAGNRSGNGAPVRDLVAETNRRLAATKAPEWTPEQLAELGRAAKGAT